MVLLIHFTNKSHTPSDTPDVGMAFYIQSIYEIIVLGC